MTQIELPIDLKTATKSQGPRASMNDVDFSVMGSRDKLKWVCDARITAILGSNARTLPSVRSGVRCYLAFAGLVCDRVNIKHCVINMKTGHHGVELLPPRLDILLAWSTLFRCVGTWKNYLGHVKTCCLLADVSTKVALFCPRRCIMRESRCRCLIAQP